nr:MAG TPA: hypothetical protein [Caudoviricetes sp.]DAY27987.1 MAG TPA: hypothetical protein [Caudoviricetes sp.]
MPRRSSVYLLTWYVIPHLISPLRRAFLFNIWG